MPAAKERRGYGGGAVATKLNGSLGTGDLSINCVDLTTWPPGQTGPNLIPVCAIINPGEDNAEKIYYSPRSGNTMENVERGADGTSPQTHVSGEPVEHVFSAQDADEANSHISDPTTDDHPQYVNIGVVRTITAAHIHTAPEVFTDHPVFNHIGSSSPVVVDTGAASAGTSPDMARADHKHAINLVAALNAMIPVGIPFPYFSSVQPSGWLFFNGQAVSRTAYPDSFAFFGVTYGAGDGHSTFNLPNMDGFVPVGVDSNHPLGQTGGALTTTQVAQHAHGVNDAGHVHGVTDNGHVHQPVQAGSIYEMVISSPNTEQHYVPANGHGDSTGNTQVTYSPIYNAQTGVSINNATTGVSTQNSGITAVSIEQPWIGVYWMGVAR